MVTTQEIESLGWRHRATAKNGGSKLFELNDFTLFSHSDNFLKKLDKDSIKLSTYHWNAIDYKKDIKVIFDGPISSVEELIELMVRFNVDKQLTRDTKIDQINK